MVATSEDEAVALAAFHGQREREALERQADEAMTVERMAEGWRW
jgi:hypothetical protein